MPIHRRRSVLMLLVIASVISGLLLLHSEKPRPASATSEQHPYIKGAVANAETSPTSGVSASGAYTLSLPIALNSYEPPIDTLFGVQIYRSLSEESVALSLARQARVSWIRWPIAWSQVEPTNTTPDGYNWSSIDASIANASKYDLRVIGTLQSNPGWAATYAQGPIEVDLEEFTTFVAAAVERYDGDGYKDAPGSPVVTYWEFYNEPDAANITAAEEGYGGYWGFYGDRYAEMLCAVYPELKKASQDAQVALGGIAYDSFQEEDNGSFVKAFLGDVLANGGGACMDVMNFHYYPYAADRWAPYGNGFGLIGKAAYLRENYPEVRDKPMIVTEAGWHSDDMYPQMPSTDEIQSRYVVRLFAQAKAVDLESLIWWTWIDPSPPYTENGLLTQELSPKPSYDAYSTAANMLGAAEFVGYFNTPNTVKGFEFISRRGNPLYVIWATDDQMHSVSVDGSSAVKIDMYGHNSSVLRDSADGMQDNQIRTLVGPNPIYLEIR